MDGRIAQFLGPIFAKAITEIARRFRYYLCRTVYGAALVLIMYIVWQEFQVFAARVGIGNSLARVAGAIFTATSYVQYWAVYLLVPAFLGGVIAGEREERTLELLFITPLSDREIVLGKLFSRIAAMVCLILCGFAWRRRGTPEGVDVTRATGWAPRGGRRLLSRPRAGGRNRWRSPGSGRARH